MTTGQRGSRCAASFTQCTAVRWNHNLCTTWCRAWCGCMQFLAWASLHFGQHTYMGMAIWAWVCLLLQCCKLQMMQYWADITCATCCRDLLDCLQKRKIQELKFDEVCTSVNLYAYCTIKQHCFARINAPRPLPRYVALPVTDCAHAACSCKSSCLYPDAHPDRLTNVCTQGSRVWPGVHCT